MARTWPCGALMDPDGRDAEPDTDYCPDCERDTCTGRNLMRRPFDAVPESWVRAGGELGWCAVALMRAQDDYLHHLMTTGDLESLRSAWDSAYHWFDRCRDADSA